MCPDSVGSHLDNVSPHPVCLLFRQVSVKSSVENRRFLHSLVEWYATMTMIEPSVDLISMLDFIDSIKRSKNR